MNKLQRAILAELSPDGNPDREPVEQRELRDAVCTSHEGIYFSDKDWARALHVLEHEGRIEISIKRLR